MEMVELMFEVIMLSSIKWIEIMKNDIVAMDYQVNM